jgi:acyl carrier protein
LSSRDAVEERIQEIMAIVFQRPVTGADGLRFGTEPWDSLRHVELIFTIEDEFGIRFDESELTDLTSFPALAEAVSRRLTVS